MKPKQPKDYEQQKPEKKTVDPVLTEVIGKFTTSRKYIKKGFSKQWSNARKLYNNERVEANYIGNSDTFVPETFTIIQSVKANTVGGKIKIEFLPTRADQTGDARILNTLMDQIQEKDQTKLKASWAIDDSLVTGNGYLWQYVKDNLPCNIYVPTEDNFFDPTATNYENLRYGGYRYLTTIEDLKKETITNPDYDENTPDSKRRIPKYKNLDKVKPLQEVEGAFKVGDDKTAKQQREEMLSGSPFSDSETNKDKVVEVIVYFDKKRMIHIANRCEVILNEETPFKREKTTIKSVDDQGNPVPVTLPEIPGFIPVAPARDYVDGAMWYAKGEAEIIGELQELLNDTQNQKTDNLNYSLNRMWMLDPSQSHKKDEIQSVPGAVFTIPPGSLEAVQNASIGADADNEMAKITSAMRRATAADELIQGSQQAGDVTATEVRAQLAQAGTRFGSKLENYETEFFTILYKNMFKILQIFCTQEMAVRMVGPNGVEWKNYNPGEFLGDYDVRVLLEGSARVLEETEKQEAMQFFLMATKMPFVDQQTLFKITSEKIFKKDSREVESLIKPPMDPALDPMNPTPNPLVQQAASQMGVMDAEGNPMPQAGQGVAASDPMSAPEAAMTNDAMNAQGMNVEGMPQA